MYGMGHVGGDAGVGEEVGKPPPAVGGFEGHLNRCRAELAEDPEELLGTLAHT